MTGLTDLLNSTDDTHIAGIAKLSFQRLIENNADGILVVDLSGAVLYANPAAARIFGRPLDKLLHVPIGRPIVAGDIAELTVRRPGGKTAEVEMSVVEVAWDGTAALLASLRDVSAQRALEEHRRQSQKMEAIGRLAASIVHDMNNLLSVIEGGLNLLEKQLAQDPTHPKVPMLFEELRKRTQNGGALTQQLLAFSRQQSLTPEIIDINECIEALTNLLGQTLGRGIQIRRKLEPDLAPVLIDPNQLDVAILNLAVNARDAMDGAGTLRIETANVSELPEEANAASGAFIRVTVGDTGCGMSKEVQAQVFEPFFTTKCDGQGTGLGLSQVYGFVKQSGGSIRIDSEVEKGTSVHLFLPCAQTSGRRKG